MVERRRCPWARELLRDGDVDVLGRMPWSSNATFLVNLSQGDELLAIYKPQRGERPLWDFPRGTLCHREVAAFEVSEALGWDIVPDTVLRDGPAGIGMMQRFVEHDPEEHYFTLLEEHGDDVPAHGRVRRRDQQHRPQGRPLPGRSTTDGSSGSTTASRFTRSGSCAPSSGTSAASRFAPECVATSTAGTSSYNGARAPRRPLAPLGSTLRAHREHLLDRQLPEADNDYHCCGPLI